MKTILPNREWFKREFTLREPASWLLWGIRVVYFVWIVMDFIVIQIYNLTPTKGDYAFMGTVAIIWFIFYCLQDWLDIHDRKFWKNLFFQSQDLVYLYAQEREKTVTILKEAIAKSEELQNADSK